MFISGMSDNKLFFHGASGRQGREATSPTPQAAPLPKRAAGSPHSLPSSPVPCCFVPVPRSPHAWWDEGSSPSQVPKERSFSRCSASWHVTVSLECPLYAVKIDTVISTVLGQAGSGFLFFSLPLFHQTFFCRCIHTTADFQPAHVSSALQSG